LLEAVTGAVVWLIANGVYVDMRRKGTRGFARVCAFWMGMPATWAWLLVVREGQVPRIAAPADDEDALLAEVRMDRALRTRAANAETRELPPDAE
jgi:hypothetical protein